MTSEETTRRAFLCAIAAGAGSLACERIVATTRQRGGPADVNLRIGRVRVDVAPGYTVDTVGYNGSVPAPLIRLREGVPALVDIQNDTDTPEYVHWHGLQFPAEIDGTEEEESLVVPPHGQLRYRITPRETGSRWVHSHAMAISDLTRGVYSGQFGFVYVEPRTEPGSYDQEVFIATHEWGPALILEGGEDDDDDTTMKLTGQKWAEPKNKEVAYDIGSINGRSLGYGEPIRVKRGQRVLFRVLNASATANTELALSGHQFRIVALDGNPVPHPQLVDVLKVGIAERVDAVVEMKNPGVWIFGETNDDSRVRGLVGIVVEYAGSSGVPQWRKPQTRAWEYTIFGEDRPATDPDEVIPMVIGKIPLEPDGIERWTINGNYYDAQNTPTALRRGRRYRLTIRNRTGEEHPIHLHRNTFEIAKVDGRETSGIKKDVVLAKAFSNIEVDFTPEQKGLVLFHCHQQLHMDFGFKTLFRVV